MLIKNGLNIIFLILLFQISLNANWKKERESLDNLYQLDYFRIFYTLKGVDALPLENQKDLNKNGTPDYIENVAQRLKITKDVFTNILTFQDPLKSKRFKQVKYVDVHILPSKFSSSGDGIITYNYKILKTKDKVLSMKIRTDLSKDSLTPSHEYFHLLQNSYTMFKNRWYTEGTARWSEKVFDKAIGKRGNLPQNEKQLNILLNMTYDAKVFWNKLAYICDKNNGKFNAKNINTNVPNYPKLIKDEKVFGYLFMKKFLENMDKQDNLASINRNWKEFSWKEKEQKYNEHNNKYILQAILDTTNTNCPSNNSELNGFKILIKKYIQNRKGKEL